MAIDPQTILTESKDLVGSFLLQIDDALENLNTYINGRITWVGYPPPIAFAPSLPTPVPLGQLPILTPAVLGADLGNPLSELDSYKGHTFIAPFLDQMQPILMGWIKNGGVGISDDVQNALWQNNRQRRLQSLSDVLDQISSRDAKRGFAYPTSRRASDAVLVQYQQDDENLNWQITAKMAELAQQNVQFAIAQNISIENLQASFSQGMGGLFLNLKKLIVDTFAVESNERIEEFKAQIQALVAGYQVAEINGKLSISYQELLEKQWEVLMVQGTDRTKSLIAQAENQTRVQLDAAKYLVESLEKIIQAALFQTNGIVAQINSQTSGGV